MGLSNDRSPEGRCADVLVAAFAAGEKKAWSTRKKILFVSKADEEVADVRSNELSTTQHGER